MYINIGLEKQQKLIKFNNFLERIKNNQFEMSVFLNNN